MSFVLGASHDRVSWFTSINMHLILVESWRQCFPTEVCQWSSSLRWDGAQVALLGEGNQEGWHPYVGYRWESRGPATPRDDWSGSYLWEVREWAAGSEPECWGTKTQFSGVDRA